MKLFLPIEFMILTFSLCTIVFHIALYARILAATTRIIWVTIIASTSIGYLVGWVRSLRVRGDGTRFHWWILAIAALWAIPMLFVLRQNNDDLSLYHRVVWQLGHLDQPFVLVDTTHGVPDLPAISNLHLTTAYEPLVGLVADLFHIDPILAYHNIGPFFGSLALVLVYAILYRRFRFDRTHSLLATLAALCYFLIDGGTGRAFGKTGKRNVDGQDRAMAGRHSVDHSSELAVSVPAHLVAIRGVVLDGCRLRRSEQFGNLPLPSFGLLSFGWLSGEWRIYAEADSSRLFLNMASLYCLGFAAAIVLKVIPEPADRDAWAVGWPTTWYSTLILVIPNWQTLLRDVAILFLIVPFSLKRPVKWLLILYTLTGHASFSLHQ